MAKATVLHDPTVPEEKRSGGERFVDWKPVGAGGSADVYRVFDSELGIALAIKILKQAHREDRRYIESLRREVLISRRLRHTNICPIHDLYEGERGVGIVMDLIEGHDLKPGQSIQVEMRDQAADSVVVRGRNDRQLTIGTRAASKLLVQVSDGDTPK